MYAVSASPRENPIVSAPSKFVVHPNRVPRAQPRRSWCRESSRSLARGYAFARYAAKRSRASSGQRPPGSRWDAWRAGRSRGRACTRGGAI